ncbi:archaellum component FlaF (FlaF/FlaG flagellin family) [Paenibacillus amylolyticus]|uniref:Archaellum component FlaF (FlaF/FlaG flagellin family) n=1 Tax=Paenibacillus amylolyticus TaxID=1451 RepID=A0AAP5H918_PAEAM|nr:hypothetical protein [Paenibacillus amylolyticus]MDR6726166.1 archaellum component FlaF (FlaF/FlaG flagellin family) [Paenibacillus amylolyticus]
MKMNSLKKAGSVIILLILGLILIAGCGNSQSTPDEEEELTVINVERTGGFLTGFGKVKVFIDGEEVMKVKNDEINSVELSLIPGEHTIQTKGQGDKSSVVKFEVVAGEVNEFTYHTEISNIYGVSLDRIE